MSDDKWLELVAKYQSNPYGKLSAFEAIRNHLEIAHRTCNENYAWAMREKAAARELLDALKAVVALEHDDCTGTAYEGKCKVCPAMTTARAAIAKATGVAESQALSTPEVQP